MLIQLLQGGKRSNPSFLAFEISSARDDDENDKKMYYTIIGSALKVYMVPRARFGGVGWIGSKRRHWIRRSVCGFRRGWLVVLLNVHFVSIVTRVRHSIYFRR